MRIELMTMVEAMIINRNPKRHQQQWWQRKGSKTRIIKRRASSGECQCVLVVSARPGGDDNSGSGPSPALAPRTQRSTIHTSMPHCKSRIQ